MEKGFGEKGRWLRSWVVLKPPDMSFIQSTEEEGASKNVPQQAGLKLDPDQGLGSVAQAQEGIDQCP
jgi:hypothetical protein